MNTKKIKAKKKNSKNVKTKLIFPKLELDRLANSMEFQPSLSPELDEILKKNPKHFLGCGG